MKFLSDRTLGLAYGMSRVCPSVRLSTCRLCGRPSLCKQSKHRINVLKLQKILGAQVCYMDGRQPEAQEFFSALRPTKYRCDKY